MKKKLLVLIAIIMFISGCTKEEVEENPIVYGQEKLENYQYDEALTYFSEILNKDSKNESARSMYMQARKMQNAQRYEESNKYDRAIEELEDIVNINNGSNKIKRESINKKEELEKLQEEREKEALQRKEIVEKTSRKDMQKLGYSKNKDNNKK